MPSAVPPLPTAARGGSAAARCPAARRTKLQPREEAAALRARRLRARSHHNVGDHEERRARPADPRVDQVLQLVRPLVKRRHGEHLPRPSPASGANQPSHTNSEGAGTAGEEGGGGCGVKAAFCMRRAMISDGESESPAFRGTREQRRRQGQGTGEQQTGPGRAMGAARPREARASMEGELAEAPCRGRW